VGQGERERERSIGFPRGELYGLIKPRGRARARETDTSPPPSRVRAVSFPPLAPSARPSLLRENAFLLAPGVSAGVKRALVRHAVRPPSFVSPDAGK